MSERPPSRRLRILAFGPSLATRLKTATINELTLEVPWEELGPGPTEAVLSQGDRNPCEGPLDETP